MRIDPIILGHNQFIGVDHLSQDRARNHTKRFTDIILVDKLRLGRLIKRLVTSSLFIPSFVFIRKKVID